MNESDGASKGRRWFGRRFILLLAALTLPHANATAGELAHSASRAQATPAPSAQRVLHVMADPNNLPFSNERGEGFENKLVGLIARELGARVEYTWWAQRRGWVRNTFKQGPCDLVAGVPQHFGMLLTTAPYYRSTYALVYRRDASFSPISLDDPALHRARIGVQMIGDDFCNTPPAHALASRGIVYNVHGYTVYGDYSQPNPPAQIVDAVLNRQIDVACVWGPLAGYFAHQHPGELTVVPLPARDIRSDEPFAFAIAVGVRKNEPALRDRVNAILTEHRAEIHALLAQYGVPQVDLTAPVKAADALGSAAGSVTQPKLAAAAAIENTRPLPAGPPRASHQTRFLSDKEAATGAAAIHGDTGNELAAAGAQLGRNS